MTLKLQTLVKRDVNEAAVLSHPAKGLARKSFRQVWATFLGAACRYKDQYRKVPVLIIDNVNQLAGYVAAGAS